MGLDRTYYVRQFIFSCFFLHFLFIPCGRLSWLSVSFLLHVKYTHTQYQYNSVVLTSSIDSSFVKMFKGSMPKIISESCELVKLCHINCSGPGYFESHCVK